MKVYSGEQHVNVNSDTGLTVLEPAELVRGRVGFSEQIVKNTSKPDGTLRKLMAANKLRAVGA